MYEGQPVRCGIDEIRLSNCLCTEIEKRREFVDVRKLYI